MFLPLRRARRGAGPTVRAHSQGPQSGPTVDPGAFLDLLPHCSWLLLLPAVSLRHSCGVSRIASAVFVVPFAV